VFAEESGLTGHTWLISLPASSGGSEDESPFLPGPEASSLLPLAVGEIAEEEALLGVYSVSVWAFDENNRPYSARFTFSLVDSSQQSGDGPSQEQF
jgi:hypothetical protein